EHDDGRVRHQAVLQHIHCVPDLGLELGLESQVERGTPLADRRHGGVLGPLQHPRREMRSEERTGARRGEEGLLGGASRVVSRGVPERDHPGERHRAAGAGAVRAHQGVVPRGSVGERRQQRRLAEAHLLRVVRNPCPLRSSRVTLGTGPGSRRLAGSGAATHAATPTAATAVTSAVTAMISLRRPTIGGIIPPRMRFRRRPVLLAAAILAGCDHTQPFHLPDYGAPPPPAGAQTRLTYNFGQDRSPAWLPEGGGFYYSRQRLDRADGDWCLALLPPDGGGIRREICDVIPAAVDSIDACQSPGPGPGGPI